MKNLSLADRIARISVAIVIGILYIVGEFSGILAIVLGIVAIILAATSVISFCPIYYGFKISTKKTTGMKSTSER
jgi:Inner membrane protein YgaP-like, transmembrane domain